MATAIPRSEKEQHQQRVRAMTLWLLGAVLLAVTGFATYYVVVGFDAHSQGSVEAVAVQPGGHDLVVRSTVGSPGCGDPAGIEVEETQEQVELLIELVIPQGTQWEFECDDTGATVIDTVRLNAPLGERTVIDAANPGAEVEIVDSPAELIDAG